MISIPASEETVASGFNSTSIIEISLNSSFNYSYAPFLEENATANSSKDMFSNLTESSNSIVFPAYIRITSMIFCVIIMCLGVIGNIMVPVVIFKTKDMRNSTNIFLVNLSIADLMVLLVCTPTVLVEVNSKPETWVLGEEMCKAVPFVELTVAHASVLTILAISFERYYAICKPLKAGYICTKARASLICLLAWLVAALCTSPILAITQYDLEQYYDGTIVSVCFSSVQTLLPSLFFILTVSAFFFIPLVILIIIYLLIAVTLMEQPHILAAPRKDSSNQSSLGAIKYRKQVVIMLGTVVLAFFICLLPFRALTLWIIIVPAESIMSLGLEGYYNLLYFSRIMFHINSAINPILYNIMSSKFRNGFFKLCHIKSLKKRRGRGTWIFRKSTITTTSTNATSQSTSESFWNRYSNRTSSSSKSGKKDNAPKTVCSSQNNKEKSYIRIPLQNLNNISILKMIRCESYV